ncbi:PAS domain S-box protein [Algoriphagus sp.]|uniref:PAS domain S-box protein n=1 Tax=Algoriphagus sp. TaxID=1872435 RepID=UPI0026149083|nr:PAS domain S-box protein [Algoriphagus sp.]
MIIHANDGVLITEAEPLDEPGPRIIYANHAFERMTGYSASELIGKTPRILQGPKSDRKELARLGRALRKWEPCEITTVNYKKNGEEFWCNFSVSPVADEKGWFTHWIAIERDVTDQKNEEIQKQLLAEISEAFNSSNNMKESLDEIVELMTEFGSFNFCEIWLPNLKNSAFRLSSIHAQDEIAKTFRKLSKCLRVAKIGEGLPGKVWETQRAVNWDEQDSGAYFLRREAAQMSGMKSLFGIPLKHQQKVVGVMVLGTAEDKSTLKRYRSILTRLENFIGSEIHRKRLESDLSHLFEALPDLICLADFEGNFLRINQSGCALLGYSESEILGMNFEEFVHPADLEMTQTEIVKLKEGQTIFQFENRFISKSGEAVWLSWHGNSRVEEGLIFASAKDITQERKFRDLAADATKLARIGNWEADLVNNRLYWSEMVHEIHETDAQNYIPNLDEGVRFYRSDYVEMVSKNIGLTMTEGKPFDFEAPIITAKGNERWVRVIGQAEMAMGKCIRFFGSFQDIHKQKIAEQAVQESEAKFRTIFEIASLGIVQVSPSDGKILLANSYYEAITGYTFEELQQMKFSELTHPEDRDRDWQLFQKAVKGEVEYRNEKRYIRKDGSIVWVKIHLAFIKDDRGVPIRTVAICENITDRKEIESRLKNLSDNVPGVVFQYVIHPDGNDELNYVSKGSKIIWGFEPEVAMADNRLVWNRIEAGGDLDLVQGSIAESIQNKTRWTAKWKYPLPSGEIRTHIGHGAPEFLADGTVVFNSLILDVTEEKRTEDLLHQATSMARIGSWELDLINQSEDAMYWSPMTRKILGVNESYNPSLTGGFEFYVEESEKKIKSAIENLINRGIEFDEELLLIRTDGEKRWIRCIGKGEFLQGKCGRIFGSFQDIHSSKSLETQISEILGSISDAFYAVNQDWNFTFFNKEAERLLGRKSEELLGKNIWEEIAPAKGTILEETYRRVAETGISKTFEYLYPGNDSWYELNAYPSNGGVSSYFKNIDERKKNAEALQAAYEEKTRILESIGDAFFAVDQDWNVTYWNREAELVLGRKREVILGRNLWDEYADAIDSDFYREYHRAMDAQEMVSFEEYYPALKKWFEVAAYPSLDGLSVYFKDITLRKETDIRIRQANERFEKVTQATTDAIWDWDIEGNKFYRGEGFEKLFGYKVSRDLSEELFWTDTFYPDDLPQIKESLHACLEDPSIDFWQQLYRIIHSSGEIKTVIDKGVIIRNEEGKPIRMVGAITDISDQIKHEKELHELNLILKQHIKELQVTNEQLEQFAFIASHDLQEPLRMISSFLNLLQRKYGDQLDEKAHQYIHFATDGAKRMKRIILDLLDYSRAGREEEAMEPLNLREIFEEYRILRRKVIQEKEVDLNAENLPVITAFKAPLIQTLHCLLDNAIKYSVPDRKPIVHLEVSESINTWTIAVRDNGIGIDPKFFEKIFVIFQRLHDRDEYGGTGIGLSIAKKHVESWGGKIFVESQKGQGSTFYFTVPRSFKLKDKNE